MRSSSPGRVRGSLVCRVLLQTGCDVYHERTMKKLSLLGLMTAFAILSFLACSGGETTAGGSPRCVPGEQIVCACPGSSVTGAQVCNALGSGYGACEGCPGGSGSGSGGASSVAAGTGGATSAATAGKGGGTTAASGPATTAASSATGGMGCDSGDCDVCSVSMCAEQVCATEMADCQNDNDCTALVACIAQCPMDDFDCYRACDNMYPNGSGLWNALEYCKICTACSVDCVMICA